MASNQSMAKGDNRQHTGLTTEQDAMRGWSKREGGENAEAVVEQRGRHGVKGRLAAHSFSASCTSRAV